MRFQHILDHWAKICLNLIWKSHRFVPFGVNSTHVGNNSYIRAVGEGRGGGVKVQWRIRWDVRKNRWLWNNEQGDKLYMFQIYHVSDQSHRKYFRCKYSPDPMMSNSVHVYTWLSRMTSVTLTVTVALVTSRSHWSIPAIYQCDVTDLACHVTRTGIIKRYLLRKCI